MTALVLNTANDECVYLTNQDKEISATIGRANAFRVKTNATYAFLFSIAIYIYILGRELYNHIYSSTLLIKSPFIESI